MSDSLQIHSADLRRFVRDALTAVGMSGESATAAADVLASADDAGVSTHGVKLLHGYLVRLKAGGIKPRGEPKIMRDGPAWALVDGDDALGMMIGLFAMRTAIEKATHAGVAYVGVRNSCHFGAAGYYAMMAAKAGLIGVAVANDVPSVVAPGATRAVVGTNPFAYAIPARRHPPILLDVAISTVAGGKVYQARMRGQPIPANWIVGEDGLPTTDANLYPDHAFLVPAAGHKGYGLALLIETLSGLVTGAAVTRGIGSWMFTKPSDPTSGGAAFMALDPAVFGSRDEFLDRVDALIDEIHETPAVAGSRIMVPGEIEAEKVKLAAERPLELASDVVANLRKAAEFVGLTLADYARA